MLLLRGARAVRTLPLCHFFFWLHKRLCPKVGEEKPGLPPRRKLSWVGKPPPEPKMRAFFLPQSPPPLATLPRGEPMARSVSVVLRFGAVSHLVRTAPYRVSHPGRTSNTPTLVRILWYVNSCIPLMSPDMHPMPSDQTSSTRDEHEILLVIYCRNTHWTTLPFIGLRHIAPVIDKLTTFEQPCVRALILGHFQCHASLRH